jgi:hypothetical protein
MDGADRQQLVVALVLLVTALFVSVGLVKPQYRATVRWVSVAGFLIALVVVLIWVAEWLMTRL